MDDARPLSLDKTWHESFRPGQVKIEAVQPVDKLAPFGGRCLALRNVLSSEECAYLIKEMSAQGCLEAVAYRSDYRKNDRCVFFAQELADLLWRIEAVTETFAVEVEADPGSTWEKRQESARPNYASDMDMKVFGSQWA